MKRYSSLQYKTKKDRGFTIIETLVAITILMIAIAGPLTIVHKGLLAATYASQQVTASYLAQDAIEYLKNVRDNNMIKDPVNWLNILNTCTDDPLGHCSVDTIAGFPNGSTRGSTGISTCVPTSGGCVMYKIHKGGYDEGYDYNPTGIKTPFSRYFYVTPVQGNGEHEAKMVVVVSWNSGTIPNVFSYENEIFDVTR